MSLEGELSEPGAGAQQPPGGLGESDRAQVSCDFEAVGVSDGRLELVGGEEVVGLEGGDALTDPVVDPAAGNCGVGELIDLNGEGSRAFEVGSATG